MVRLPRRTLLGMVSNPRARCAKTDLLQVCASERRPMSSVTFDRVRKVYGDVVAVDDLSLTVDDGEFMVLLGPSGCGKSTALRMVAGLEEPTSGDIALGNQVVNRVPPKDRDIAMVFQSYALYPHMTVRANIEFPLKARKVERSVRVERVEAAAETLGLSELLDRKPGQLSGGQRQRVAAARAIVRRPQAFLMDEPLSNLDAKLRVQTRIQLVQLHQQLGTTFLYVTHDQVEAMTMADRIAVLHDGRLQQVDRPSDVYDRPANAFVARFIGSPPMNVVPATITIDGSALTLNIAGLALDLSTKFRPEDLKAGDVLLGIRPEDLIPAEDGLQATVLGVESLGHEAHIVAQCGGHQLTARIANPRGSLPHASDVMRFAVDADDVHLFDATSEQRIADSTSS